MMKGIYAEETSTEAICTKVACILGSFAEEGKSYTSSIMKVVMINAMIDNGKEAWRHDPV